MDMNVALKITAGVTGQQAVDQLRTSMDRMKDSVEGVSNRFGMLKGALAGLAGTAVVAGFVGMMRSIIETADHLNDLSQRTGIAVEDLDALGYAAELNGTNLDAVSGALGKLAKNMAEAAGGGKEAIAVFAQFGISQEELASGSITADEALARVADKIAAMPDGWQKTAAAQQVFGKSAAELVPLLNGGGDAIRGARTELESMGALFTGTMAQAGDQFNDNMSKLRRMAGALGLSIAQEVMPVLNGFVQGMIDAKTSTGNLAGDTSLQQWAAVAAQSVAALVDVIRVATQGVFSLIGSFQAVWADIQLAGTFLAGGKGLNPFSSENQRILDEALARRNATVKEANDRYLTLWNMNGSAVFDAVKAQMDRLGTVISGGAATSRTPGAGFDFGAGKESEFSKLLQQMNDQLAKTGEVTKSEELLRLFQSERYRALTVQQRAELMRVANLIDAQQERTRVEQEMARHQEATATATTQRLMTEWTAVSKLKDTKADELALLRLEADAVNMTTQEYQSRVRQLQHEQSVREAMRSMLPETAAAYKRIADESFIATERQRQYNETQGALQSAVEKLVVSKSDELSMLQLEGRAVNMSTREYEYRVRQLQNEFDIREATKDMLPDQAQAYRDIANATFEATEAQRRLNAEQGMTFEAGARRALRSYSEQIKDVAKSTEEAVGRAFKGMEDALVNFVMTGKLNFSDLARSILSDMARIVIQQQIMRPLMASFGFGFADGGIMTANGPLPLNKYANGGIARSPQVALFGEGRMPEAYVPLPDGRTIPVTMQGGGGGTNVVVNVNMETGQQQAQGDNQRGTDLGLVIASVVKQELINQRRPGGVLAAA